MTNTYKKAAKAERIRQKAKQRMRLLDEYDARGYYRDMQYLGRLSWLPMGTRQWIEARMYELRGCANRYEHLLGEFLIEKKIAFIHQAPFVFRPRTIYFCDFFLPDYRLVVEVDGVYHNGDVQFTKDRERDANLRSIGMRVVRIANEELGDTRLLALRLGEYIRTLR